MHTYIAVIADKIGRCRAHATADTDTEPTAEQQLSVAAAATGKQSRAEPNHSLVFLYSCDTLSCVVPNNVVDFSLKVCIRCCHFADEVRCRADKYMPGVYVMPAADY